jgi:hypothetical protein
VRASWGRLVEFGGLAIAVFVVGVVVGAGVVYGLHKQTSVLGSGKATAQRVASSEVAPDPARALAERFRPWLRFDSAERWRPLNIARLFAERINGAPAHRLCAQGQSGARCEPVGSEAEFTRLVHEGRAFGTGLHLDLAGTALKDYRGPGSCAPLFDCGGAPGSAIYYHVTRSNDRYYIDYWWFLRFNDFYRTSASCRHAAAIANGLCDQHEGDWEGVTVVTPPDRSDKLDYVVYAAHKGTFRYAAAQLRSVGVRPEVFLAQGSHAAYPAACPRAPCSQPVALAAEGLVKLPEGRFDGATSWERNADDCRADVPTSCLLSLPRSDDDPNAWTFWPGQWGAGCEAACNGLPGVNSPQSPGEQQRYRTPSCSLQGDTQTCDGKALGCSDWLGPLVAVVACNPSLLASAFSSANARDAGSLKLTVGGRRPIGESSPGIAQSLGDPLEPGADITVSGGNAATQVLVRAQRRGHIIEARFSNLGLGAGRSAHITIHVGRSDDRVILLEQPGGTRREADELRIVRPQAAG